MVAPTYSIGIEEITNWPSLYDAIIDVRSPKEYRLDHIPGAINLPVLNDEERASVGTIYKQINPFEARRLGAKLVSRNIANHFDSELGTKPQNWRPLVYCWRGGQRSSSMARVLAETGWRTAVLDGGYQTYRRWVQSCLADLSLKPVLLCGMTGSAKTQILKAVGELGAQVLDLEGLASHRGSLLGFEPAAEQPSQRRFESLIRAELAHLSPEKPLLIEAESSRIGACHIPHRLWRAMQNAPRIDIDAKLESRIDFLIKDYPHLLQEPQRLDRLIDGMASRHSRTLLGSWREAIKNKDWAALARSLITEHYDPAYRHAKDAKNHQPLAILTAENLDKATINALAEKTVAILAEIG